MKKLLLSSVSLLCMNAASAYTCNGHDLLGNEYRFEYKLGAETADLIDPNGITITLGCRYSADNGQISCNGSRNYYDDEGNYRDFGYYFFSSFLEWGSATFDYSFHNDKKNYPGVMTCSE